MNIRYFLLLAVTGAAIVMNASSAYADVSLPGIFSENMVLQRDVPVPVWGWAADGEKVRVRVFKQSANDVLASAETVAENGKWRVTLDPMPAGGRYSMLVEGTNMILFTNVLVGEVWLTCGQSNMIWPIENTVNVDDAIAEAHKYPRIRHIQIGNRAAHEITEPQQDLSAYWGNPKWEDAEYHLPRSSRTDIPGSVSAVSYYFARELHKYLEGGVPVGMVDVGAILPVQTWVDDDTVAADPKLAHLRGRGYPSATSRGFNANIAPLAPFAVRGVIYYQGEMNAGDGVLYGYGLAALIRSWRKAWDNPELPFLIVQLPGFIEHKGERHELDMDEETLTRFHMESKEHGFSRVRQAQLDVWRNTPHTGMAVTIDLGEPYDIHPPRKREVAERLFLQARKVVYGNADVVAGGPVPVRVSRRDNQLVIHFEQTGSGLTARDGRLAGFKIRAADGEFTEAEAAIEGDTVAVQADGVEVPITVRYAWAGFPRVSLYNGENLPATPFEMSVDDSVMKGDE